ncbi:MAG: lipoate--protein ligase family protein [Nitrospirota bacterium]
MEKTWRLIDSGPCRASYNMALDEAIATYVRKGESPPTLRLYAWDMPSLSLGCFQKVSGIDAGYCSEKKIPIVRRPTGGRAILHDDELTYSFSVGTDNDLFSKGILDSYRKISVAFSLAFGKIGIYAESKKQRERGGVLTKSPLCFQSSSFGEILIDNKKAVGSAQKRWNDGLLQQGSIPYLYNAEVMCNIFRTAKTSSLRDCMVGLKEVLPGLKEDEFRKQISASFEETFEVRLVPDRPSQEEVLLAKEFEDRKYLQGSWNFRQ